MFRICGERPVSRLAVGKADDAETGLATAATGGSLVELRTWGAAASAWAGGIARNRFSFSLKSSDAACSCGGDAI